MKSSSLIPHHKHDFESLNTLIAAGNDAAIPLLDELFEWLQDINWPIAQPLADFLVPIGAPLLPSIRKVLASNDDMWIYWVLQFIVAKLPNSLINELSPEINRMAFSAENDWIAFRIGIDAGIWETKMVKWMVTNRLHSVEKTAIELRLIQDSLN
jgi:hypothetical protein